MNPNTIGISIFAVATMVAVIIAFRALARAARLEDKVEELQVESVDIMVISNQYYDALQKAKFRIAVLEAKLEQCRDVMAVNDIINHDIIFYDFPDSGSIQRML